MGVVERVGVFGGTFDPVHVGHLVAAVNVRHQLALDRLLLVPANVPWQKVGERAVTPAADRLAMVEAAVADARGLEACPLEVERGGVSYTADTLAVLTRPGRELYLVLGADAAAGLPTWERVDEVRELATLVVVDRPGTTAAAPEAWRHERVEIPQLDVSSTDLRARAEEGRPLEYLVPWGVIDCIRRRGLYRRPAG